MPTRTPPRYSDERVQLALVKALSDKGLSLEAIGERLSSLLHQDDNPQIAQGAAKVALETYNRVAQTQQEHCSQGTSKVGPTQACSTVPLN